MLVDIVILNKVILDLGLFFQFYQLDFKGYMWYDYYINGRLEIIFVIIKSFIENFWQRRCSWFFVVYKFLVFVYILFVLVRIISMDVWIRIVIFVCRL